MSADRRRHRTMLVVLLVLGAVALHAALLEWMLSHLALSATALALMMIVVVLKHVGLLGAVLRRVRRPREQSSGDWRG
jgi:hypothetical protein